jgi:hypothetical protein
MTTTGSARKENARRMNGEPWRVERIRASDARFPWAKKVEYEIFGLENDYADRNDRAAGEMAHYRPWESSSEIFVGFPGGPAGEPIGVLRALRCDPALGQDSFSTLRDARNFPAGGGSPRNVLYPEWNSFFAGVAPDRIAELATQGVRRKHRQAGMVEQLWQAFFGSLAAEGVDYVTVALVVPLFEWYSRLLPERIHQIGAVLPDYIGADSVPAVVDISGSFVTRTAHAIGRRGSLLTAARPAGPSTS